MVYAMTITPWSVSASRAGARSYWPGSEPARVRFGGPIAFRPGLPLLL